MSRDMCPSVESDMISMYVCSGKRWYGKWGKVNAVSDFTVGETNPFKTFKNWILIIIVPTRIKLSRGNFG